MKASDYTLDPAGERISTDPMATDPEEVAADAERSGATSTCGGQHFAQARGKARESLQATKVRVADLREAASARTRAARRATDAYVHANTWKLVAVSAVTGFVIGSLLARADLGFGAADGARRSDPPGN